MTIRYGKDGTISPLTLSRGDITGLSALTNQPFAYTCVAQTELTVLTVPVAVLDELARKDTRLARDIGKAIDTRLEQLDAAVRNAVRSITGGSAGPVTSPVRVGGRR